MKTPKKANSERPAAAPLAGTKALGQAARTPGAQALPNGAGREPAHGQPRVARLSDPAAGRISAKPVPAADQSSSPAAGGGGGDDELLFADEAPHLETRVTGPRIIRVGSPAHYRVAIENLGSGPARQLVAKIQLPVWAALSEAKSSTGDTQTAAPTGSFNTLVWNIGRLPAHGKEQLDLTLVPQKGEQLELAITSTFAPPSSRAVVEVQEPKLQLVVSGPDEVLYGEVKRYELMLTNPGTGPAENVVLQLLPLGGGTKAADVQQVGTLPAGSSRRVEVEFVARQSGTVVVKARAEASGGLRTEVAKDVFVRRPALQAEIEGPGTAYTGVVATYRIHVSNPGTAAAQTVTLSTSLPQGAEYVDASDGGRYIAEEGKVIWRVGALEADADRFYELQCMLKTPGKNRLEVLTEGTGELSDAAATATEVIAVADLTLDLIDPTGPVAVQGEATYKIILHNRGSKRAEGIKVVAYFSDGIEPLAAEGASHEIEVGQVVFGVIESLDAGGKMVLKIRAKANRAGNHICRTEVVCEAAGTKLASEETTRFYGPEGLRSTTSQAAVPRSASLPKGRR